MVPNVRRRTTTFRAWSDLGIVVVALVLVGVCVVMAGILAHAGDLGTDPASRPASTGRPLG